MATNQTNTKSQHASDQQRQAAAAGVAGAPPQGQSNTTSSAAVPGPAAAPAPAPVVPRKPVQSLDTSKYNIIENLPNDDVLNEKTLEGELNPLEVGEYTAELSDVSDGEGDQEKKTASRNALSTWYRRIQPLIRNKRVRAFAIINSILTVVNLFLFVACIIILGFLLFEIISVAHRTSEDKPCIYQWSEWESCSATCATATRESNGTFANISIPRKSRRVREDTIIQTRGRKYEKCPDDLAELTDTVPCNTHICPVKLSTFEYNTFVVNTDVNGSLLAPNECYIMRDIPTLDLLIELDTSDIYTKEKC